MAHWYAAQGYEVVDRNWRCRTGELDLILRQGATLVFCEVKTRSSGAFGTPAEAVTRAKQVRLRQLAAQWLGQAPRPAGGSAVGEIRFDVASVLAGEIEVLQAAF